MSKNTLILNQSKMQVKGGFLKINRPEPERNTYRDPRSKVAVGKEGCLFLRNADTQIDTQIMKTNIFLNFNFGKHK